MRAVYRFGTFELDPEAGTLLQDGRRVQLEKIPFDLLALLLSRAGTLVDRAAIEAQVWGDGVFIERDAAINTAVRKIRQVLGDSGDRPRYVETAVRRGYRFVAPVQRITHGAGSPARFALVRGQDQTPVGDGEHVLGRDPLADVRVDHPSVSRRHARLSIDGDRALVEDLASRNGTFVDGISISVATPVRPGAVLGIGPVQLFFVSLTSVGSTQPMAAAQRQEPSRGERPS